jgi:hypothetical protein
MRKWVTMSELNFVKAHYGKHSAREIAKMLNCKPNRIQGIILRYNLKTSSSPIFPKNHGQINKFKKGNITAGAFKIGNIPHNKLPDNTIRFKSIGKGLEPLKQIKVEGKWVNYYKWLYSTYYNVPITSSSVVKFKDGNKENDNIDNIEIISKKQFLKEYREDNAELIAKKISIGQKHYYHTKKKILDEISKYTFRNN